MIALTANPHAPAKSAAQAPAAPAPQQKESAAPAEANSARRLRPPANPSLTTNPTSAPLRWSARSPASTTSISTRSPAPDSADASPSRTSWTSSRRPSNCCRRAADRTRAAGRRNFAARISPRAGLSASSGACHDPGRPRSHDADAQDHRAAHDRVPPHQRSRPLHVRSRHDPHRQPAQQAQEQLRAAPRRPPDLHAVLRARRHHRLTALSRSSTHRSKATTSAITATSTPASPSRSTTD